MSVVFRDGTFLSRYHDDVFPYMYVTSDDARGGGIFSTEISLNERRNWTLPGKADYIVTWDSRHIFKLPSAKLNPSEKIENA